MTADCDTLQEAEQELVSLYLDVDDLVPDEGLQKYADQPYQPKKIGKASQTDEDAPVLHVLVLDGLTGGNTV